MAFQDALLFSIATAFQVRLRRPLPMAFLDAPPPPIAKTFLNCARASHCQDIPRCAPPSIEGIPWRSYPWSPKKLPAMTQAIFNRA